MFIRNKFEWSLFLSFCSILIFGIFSIYTASSTKIGNEIFVRTFYLKQIIWSVLAVLLLFIIYKIPYHYIDSAIYPMYFVTLFFLILVLILPAIKGSHRWINLGLFNFQPSEFSKIVIILTLSKTLSAPKLTDFMIIRKSLAITVIPFILILMEPDLGTSLTLIVILIAILSFSKLSFFWIVLMVSPVIMLVLGLFSTMFKILIVGIVAYLIFLVFFLKRSKLSTITIISAVVTSIFSSFIGPVIWNFLHSYQQKRILTFINPMMDPLGAGYQIIQSKIAIGSGGLFGKGFLEGSQKNLDFIPEHHTDFIFSVIGEELGFIGCLTLIVLFAFMLSRMIFMIKKFNSLEKKLATIGIFAYILFQIFVNIGMNIGVVPTTGLPLPFISYGGTSLLINTLGIGIVLKYYSVDRRIL